MNSRAILRLMAHIAARHAGVSFEEFTGPARRRDVAWPRQHFMLAARLAGASYPEIARLLNRHHVTVMHGVKAAQDRYERSLTRSSFLPCPDPAHQRARRTRNERRGL